MSRRPDDPPTDGPLRAVRQTAGRPRLESLLQYDVENDPADGSLLYEAVVTQSTSQLTADGWLDRLEAIKRVKARLAALEAEAVAGFDDSLAGVSADLGHRYPEPGDRDASPGERRWIAGDLRSVADEVALILSMRRGHATARIHTSCELVHNFPATLYALTEGRLTERAAFTIVSELSVLDDLEDLHAAEAAILDWAGTHPLVDIKKACRREAARRSPDATDKAHQRAHDERSVRMYTDDFGRADLVHNHDAVDAAAVMTSLSRAATYRRRQGDPRTMDQLRNDIALDRLLPRTNRTGNVPAAGVPVGDCDQPGDLYDHDSGDNQGTADTALESDALNEAAAGAEATVVIHATGAEVLALINGEVSTGGEVEHHGPIPQSSLRKHILKALAQLLLPNLPATPNSSRPGAAIYRARTANTCDGIAAAGADTANANATPDGPAIASCGSSRIELQITDQPPPSDPDRYTPSPALDRYVRLRDRTCQFPGCNRPAEYTDLDHRTAFAAGGRTTAANLWCLCRHHHRLKHEGGWRLHLNPDGTHTWTNPTGRRYRNSPTGTYPPSVASQIAGCDGCSGCGPGDWVVRC